MAPGNKPKSKDKPKNQNGQGTQAPSNGGQSVSVQFNHIMHICMYHFFTTRYHVAEI